jgi:hypothetical protein
MLSGAAKGSTIGRGKATGKARDQDVEVSIIWKGHRRRLLAVEG